MLSSVLKWGIGPRPRPEPGIKQRREYIAGRRSGRPVDLICPPRQFRAGPERIIIDERRVQMHKALNRISHFGYLYDFGDSWQHTITVERISPPPEHPRGCAFIEAGERAGPPEDAGGSHSYQEFPDQFAKNPKQEEVREFLSWAGEDFNPNQFDRHAANAALLRMAWNQWGNK